MGRFVSNGALVFTPKGILAWLHQPSAAFAAKAMSPRCRAPQRRARSNVRSAWIEAFREVRGETERRAAPLSDEDQVIQSMPDASPTKWHRAHTTWFFEQFLLLPHLPGYRVFDKQFAYLFNSYYVAAGPRHARPQRGLVTRPANSEVAAYRAHVDDAVVRLIDEADAMRSSPRCCASSRSVSITSSSIRSCCSPTSCMRFR